MYSCDNKAEFSAVIAQMDGWKKQETESNLI